MSESNEPKATKEGRKKLTVKTGIKAGAQVSSEPPASSSEPNPSSFCALAVGVTLGG